MVIACHTLHVLTKRRATGGRGVQSGAVGAVGAEEFTGQVYAIVT